MGISQYPIHLISSKSPQSSLERLGNLLQQQGTKKTDKSLNVVSIIGSRKSGRTTLLNSLFGSHFSLDEESGDGVWASNVTAKDILVLDIAGSSPHRIYELFAIAVSQVVIVNVSEHNDQSMDVLKTAFEVNLQLFQQSGSTKTCLLFVFRDFTNQVPLEKLGETLVADLVRIWVFIY